MSTSRRQGAQPSRQARHDPALLAEQTPRRVVRKAAATGRLLEVEIASRPRDAHDEDSVRAGVLVVHLFGRHRVELPLDFREDDVRRLVRALSPSDPAC